MGKKARIILVRHGEEPTFHNHHDLKDKGSEIGLTQQGAVRAICLPKLIEKIIGKKKFQLHTYTHLDHNEPTSRSYYTVQNLISSKRCKNLVLYNKSYDIYELTNNIKSASKIYKNIVICWEHKQIPIIVQNLLKLNETPDYDTYVDKFNNKSNLKEKQIVKNVDNIKLCAKFISSDNHKVKTENINDKDDMSYALVWDINFSSKKFKVYPGFTIQPKSNSYLVKYFI